VSLTVDVTIAKCVPVPKTPLINREHVRQFLLDQAGKTRAHRYTRVSEDTLIAANEHLRHFLVQHVAKMPSMGKTL